MVTASPPNPPQNPLSQPLSPSSAHCSVCSGPRPPLWPGRSARPRCGAVVVSAEVFWGLLGVLGFGSLGAVCFGPRRVWSFSRGFIGCEVPEQTPSQRAGRDPSCNSKTWGFLLLTSPDPPPPPNPEPSTLKPQNLRRLPTCLNQESIP